MEIRIQRALLQDYRLVADLFNKYRIFYGQAPDLLLAEQFIKERLEKKESVIFLASGEINGASEVLGFTQLYPSFSSVRAQKNWILNDLYVEEAYRKTGVARLLMKTALLFAREEQGSSMQLETAPDNVAAQRLYETLGFKRQPSASEYFLYSLDLKGPQGVTTG